MDLTDYLSALRRGWLWILSLAVAGALVGWAAGAAQPETFRSSASLYVTAQDAQNANELAQGSTFVQNLVLSYVTLATSTVVLEEAAETLGGARTAGDLAGLVSAEAPTGTVIVTVTAEDRSAEGARDVAAATSEALQRAVADLSPHGRDGEATVRISEISAPQAPAGPAAPNVRLLTGAGAGAGAVAGIVVAVARADRAARDEESPGPRRRRVEA